MGEEEEEEEDGACPCSFPIAPASSPTPRPEARQPLSQLSAGSLRTGVRGGMGTRTEVGWGAMCQWEHANREIRGSLGMGFPPEHPSLAGPHGGWKHWLSMASVLVLFLATLQQ